MLMVLMVALAAGCTQSRITDPPKTATELYLLSVAVEHAITPLDSERLRGRLVFVDRSSAPEKEHDYLIGSVRAKLLAGGARITGARDEAEIIVEVRTPGVGIDRSELLVGIPGIPLGALTAAAGMPGTSISTPELALVKNLTQWGTAGVAYVAYWRETGELVSSSGPHIGRSYREDWTFFGISRTISNIPPTRAPDLDEDLRMETPVLEPVEDPLVEPQPPPAAPTPATEPANAPSAPAAPPVPPLPAPGEEVPS